MFTEFTALACLSIWTSRPAALAISTNLIFVSSANLRLRRIFFWSAALLAHFRAAGQMTGHSIHVNRQIGRFPVFFNHQVFIKIYKQTYGRRCVPCLKFPEAAFSSSFSGKLEELRHFSADRKSARDNFLRREPKSESSSSKTLLKLGRAAQYFHSASLTFQRNHFFLIWHL